MSNIDWVGSPQEKLYGGKETLLMPHMILESLNRWVEYKEKLDDTPYSYIQSLIIDLLILESKTTTNTSYIEADQLLINGKKIWCGPYGSLSYLLFLSPTSYGCPEELAKKALASYKLLLPEEVELSWAGSISILNPIRDLLSRLTLTPILLEIIKGSNIHPLIIEINELLLDEGYITTSYLEYDYVHGLINNSWHRLYPLLSRTIKKLGGVESDVANPQLQALSDLYLLWFDSEDNDLIEGNILTDLPIGGIDLFYIACALQHVLNSLETSNDRDRELFYAGWTLAKGHKRELKSVGNNILLSVGQPTRQDKNLFL